jgi:hypothetical protein
VRAELGPAAADVLLLLAGFGILNAIGFLRGSPGDLFGAIGLAFLAGVAFVMPLAIALLTIGLAFRLQLFVALSLATAAAGLLARRDWIGALRLALRSRRGPLSALRSASPLTRLGGFTLTAFAIYAFFGMTAAAVRPLSDWDAWSLWSRKAEELFFSGSLPVEFFASPAYGFMHPDYPLLVPVFESIQYRAMGTIDTQAIHAQFWLLLVTFVWAIAYVGARRGTLGHWVPVLMAVSIAPAVYSQLLTAYADMPMALFLALGVLLLGEWTSARDGRMLALSVLFLVASANTKNEGLMGAVVALTVAAVFTAVGRRGRDLRLLGLGAAAFVAGILPWRAWLAAEGIRGDIPIVNGFNPAYLAGRADRVWPSAKSLYLQLIDQGYWLYVIPAGAALVLVCLLVQRRRRIAAFYLATGLAAFAGLLWADWASPSEPLPFFLATSSFRVVSVLAAIAVAALLQLAAPLSEPAVSGAEHD